jgi:hypothetical protein
MTKKQKKERALLLLAYSFLKIEYEERGIEENDIKKIEKIDLELYNIYKKLERLKILFANPKIRDFLLSRVPNKLAKQSDMILVSLLVLCYFKLFNLSKEIVFVEDFEKLIKEIIDETNPPEDILKNSIEFANELVSSIFPDQKGLIEFRKLTGKFPFELLKEKEKQ